MKIIWLPIARHNVYTIADFISLDSASRAHAWVVEISDKVNQLEDFPQIGRVCPEFNDKKIRELVFKNCRIIYEIKDNEILIYTVRNYKEILDKSDIK